MECECEFRQLTASSAIQPGDICSVADTSVRLPFMKEILHGMCPGPSRRRAEVWYNQLKDPYLQTGKIEPRPCVVLPSRKDGTDGDICLMATFEKVDFEQEDTPGVPKIYREFILPVLPNSGNSRFGDPIRTCPDWCFEPRQWIIAVPMQPKTGNSGDLERWSPNGVHLCQDTLHDLVSACRRKHHAWENKLRAGTINAHDYYRNLKNSKRSPESVQTSPTTQSEAASSIPNRYFNGSMRSKQSYNGNSSLRSGSMSHFSPPGELTCSTGLFAKNKSHQTRPISIRLAEPSAPTPSTGLFAKNSPKEVGPTSGPSPKTTELQVNFKTLSVTEQLPRPRKSRSLRSFVTWGSKFSVAPSIAEEPVIENDGWTSQVDRKKRLQ
ncbi:hypothetical protein C8R43DRAFT_950642 [Mycena crocata]|nr:hypothetical protein C8R43DRAFT_950642 [Mycena crocata]